jgi:LacI family transcriptional regulator
MVRKTIKSITLADIAKELNLSKVAISKALRDHPDISTATKQLVNETVARLGYVPNFMARNLSSKKSNTIGLVVPKIAHHFFSRAIETIYETAYQNNYEIIMTVSQENAEHEIKHLQTLLAMRVDGLLISVTEQTKSSEIFDVIKQRGIPLVFFDRVIEGLGFSCVTSNDLESTFNSITEIMNRGYTKLGHLAGSQNTSIGRNRLLGFKKAFEIKGIAIPEKWIVEGGFAEEDGYKGFKALLETGELPQVIFTVTYPVALGVLLAAEEHGISISDELEVISFGGSSYNRYIKPSLSYIDQPVQQIAKTATERLIKEIKMTEYIKPEVFQIPAQLVLCNTCIEHKELMHE